MKVLLWIMALPVSMMAMEEIANPEPSTYLLMGGGLAAMMFIRNRAAKKKQ